MSSLRGDCDSRNFHSASLHREKERLTRHVVVPQIVMHGLKVPEEPPTRSIERNDGVRISIIAWTQSAEVVRARASGWNEYKVAVCID